MKTKILTGLAALSLLVGVVSTQGCYDVGYPGGGWGGGGYSTYAAGPSYYGPAFVGHPYAYGYVADLVTTDLIAADLVMMVTNSPADTTYSTAVPDTLTVDTQWRIRPTVAIRSHRG